MPATTNESQAKEENLIIRIGIDTLSLAVVGEAASSLVSYEQTQLKSGLSATANLREAFHNSELLQQPYTTVYIMTDTPTMLIPWDEYKANEAAALYDHTFTGCEQQLKISCTMPDLQTVAIFSIERELKNIIDEHFSNKHFLPICLPLWRHLNQRGNSRERQRLYGYLHGDRLEVFRFNQNRFKFCNSFAASQAQDALYFLLYVFRQLAMDASRDEIFVIGDIPRKKWLTDNLHEYVKNVIPADASDLGLTPSQRWQQIPLDMLAIINIGKL